MHAVEVSVLEMNEVRVTFDVALRREALAAQLAIVPHVGLYGPGGVFINKLTQTWLRFRNF